VGALFIRGAEYIHIDRVCENICFHIKSPSLRSRDIFVKGRKHPTIVCQQILQGVKEHHVVEGRMFP
jgi:hypothetical protein